MDTNQPRKRNGQFGSTTRTDPSFTLEFTDGASDEENNKFVEHVLGNPSPVNVKNGKATITPETLEGFRERGPDHDGSLSEENGAYIMWAGGDEVATITPNT